jgi:hypothetical protein
MCDHAPVRAIVATAHNIARVVYHLRQQRDASKAEPDPDYARQRRERELKQLTRHARKLG